MKYIYDILLNFNEDYVYEFYEWQTDDDIEYFKKVPLVRINEKTYEDISLGCTIDDPLFLNSIYNVTEIYDNKMIRHLNYAVIIINGREARGILLNAEGRVIMMSKMLVDEEEEAVEIGNTLNEKQIKIVPVTERKNIDDNYLTRYEKKKMFFLNKEIDELYINKNANKLKYLYYECSHQIEDDIDVIYDKIKLFLNNEWGANHDGLYDLVRLSYSKK